MKKIQMAEDAYVAKDLYIGSNAKEYERNRTQSAKSIQRWHREQQVVENIFRNLDCSHVLDLPCGTGRFLNILAKYSKTVVGADISPDMLGQCKEGQSEENHLSLLRCDAERLPFPDRSFDYALSMRFFNLIPFPVMKNVLMNLSRIVRKGVFVEVRLQQEISAAKYFFSIGSALANGGKWILNGFRNSEPNSSSVRKTFPAPDFEHFQEIVESAGFKIADSYDVGPSFRRTSLRVYFLVAQTSGSSASS